MPAYRDDLIGQVFGRWTIQKDNGIRSGKHYWVAQCTCGTVKELPQGEFLSGNSKSCGCLKKEMNRARLKHDYTGERIGRLTVIHQTEPITFGKSSADQQNKRERGWVVRCDCGKEFILRTHALKTKAKHEHASCGCWLDELRSRDRIKKNPPYYHYLSRIQRSAKNRNIPVTISYDELCSLILSNNIGTCAYCGENVTWLPYDSKTRPKGSTGHNLDRIDNSGGYSLDNVVVCCGDCNRTRGDRFTQEEFMLLVPVLRKIRQNRLSI